MSRYLQRVPMDFDCPINASYVDRAWNEHKAQCKEQNHDKCEVPKRPPEGPGYQLWQGTSDGPVTPVFATAEELIQHMIKPVPRKDRPSYDPREFPDNPAGQGWKEAEARDLVEEKGWKPTFVGTLEGKKKSKK